VHPGRRQLRGTATPALDRLVVRARRRLRWTRVAALVGPVVTVAAGVAVLWSVAARLVVLPLIDAWVLAGAAAAAVASLVVVAARRIPDGWAALAADGWLATKDRYATAIELRDLESSVDGPPESVADDDRLAARQVREAETAAAGVRALPGRPTPPRRWLAIAAVSVLAAGLLAASPDPHGAERDRRAREAAAVEEVRDTIEETAEELRELGAPGAAAADRLEALAERLDEVGLERALEELAATRGELARALDPDRRGQRAALDGLGRELGREPLAPGGSIRSQLDALAAALGAGELEDPDALARRLEELAGAIAGGQPEVAAALQEAADAVAGGNLAAAAGAISSASAAVGSAVASASAQSALAAADGAVSGAQQALRDVVAGQGQGDGQGQGNGQGAGEGAGSGSGSGEGAGSGSGSGAGEGAGSGAGSGQGAGQGTGTGQGGGGGAGGGRGFGPGEGGTASGRVGPNTGTGATGDGPEPDTVFAPTGVGGPDDDWNLSGLDTGSGPDAQVGRSLGPGERNRALVPYLDVLGDYRDAATRTIERAGFPAGRRDLVRDYFDQLAR
jgi:hypothetical protein